MCAWCKFDHYSRWVAEAELLFVFREWSNVGGELFLAPGVLLASRSIVFVTRRHPPLVFSVKLACLLEDPTVMVGMISWPIRETVNLTRLVQYPIKGGWSVLVCLQWLLPFTGFGLLNPALTAVSRDLSWLL